jgi:hypothetical protein
MRVIIGKVGLHEGVVDFGNGGRAEPGELAELAKATADPSLRLKNGYGQDDTVWRGCERECYPTHRANALDGWGTHCGG